MTEKIILGIDEVGRGPWAGPLVVGAVILGPEFSSYADSPTNNSTSTAPASTTPEPTTTSAQEIDERRYLWQNLTDSKKLSSQKREALNDLILKHAAATGLGWVAASEIDHYGLGPALKLAARRSVKPILAQISANLKAAHLDAANNTSVSLNNNSTAPDNPNSPATSSLLKFDEIIIDGTINLLAGTPLEGKVTLLPKADFLVKEVSAASIVAKVARDRYMTDLAGQYPGYGFESHVGYGTAAHKSALLDLGPCPEHRKSFRPIAEIIARSPESLSTNIEKSSTQPAPIITEHATSKLAANTKESQTTTSTGQKAEQIVAEYLETEQHHIIIGRNFKTKTYEIDLISTDTKAHIYFTEVKYRKTASRGTPLAAITPKKRQQIQFAAEAFLAAHPEYHNSQPHLAVAAIQGHDFQLKDWFTLPE